MEATVLIHTSRADFSVNHVLFLLNSSIILICPLKGNLSEVKCSILVFISSKHIEIIMLKEVTKKRDPDVLQMERTNQYNLLNSNFYKQYFFDSTSPLLGIYLRHINAHQQGYTL
jgi:hypothetical protein